MEESASVVYFRKVVQRTRQDMRVGNARLSNDDRILGCPLFPSSLRHGGETQTLSKR